jgi:maltose O-acetyltransferase
LNYLRIIDILDKVYFYIAYMELLRKTLKITFVRKILGKVFGTLQASYYNERYREYRIKYHIDPTFNFNGDGIIFYGDGQIICGHNSYIGRHSSINASDGCRVVIGDNVAISHFVLIYTSSKVADKDFSRGEAVKTKGDVIIGDYVWIGAGVFIKEGVKIGEDSVVGANAMVTKDVPAHCVVGGVPARILYYKKDVAVVKN